MSIDPISAGFDLARTVVEKVWPDKTEAEKAQLAAALQMVQGQVDVNKVEAASSSSFTSGWRPFIGWVCGTAFAVQFVIGPMAQWFAELAGHSIEFPQLELGQLTPVLLGMLGLGTLRTFEKIRGVA